MSADLRKVIGTAIDDLDRARVAVEAGTANALAKLDRVTLALNGAREALDKRADEARATIEEQAGSDVECMLADDEHDNDEDARRWFDSWIDDYEHEIEPLTEDEAWAIYSAAFERKRKEAGHG